jgi:hypothetical protein
MVVVGVGFNRKWPWPVVIVVGFDGVGLMNVSLSTIGITVSKSFSPSYTLDGNKEGMRYLERYVNVCKLTYLIAFVVRGGQLQARCWSNHDHCDCYQKYFRGKKDTTFIDLFAW